MSWPELMTPGQVVRRGAPWEEARFGLTIERVVVPAATQAPVEQLRREVAASTADVVIARYPAELVDAFAALSSCGRDLIFADALVYWRLQTGAGRRRAPARDLSTRSARDVAPEFVDAMVAGIFADYGNHYLANPLFDADSALSGYQEWARRSAAQQCPVVLSQNDTDIGLATTALHGDVLEVELAGLLEAARGCGHYAYLLGGLEERAQEEGARQVVISTQVHNTGVQRAWARYGFEPAAAFLTVHLVREGLLPG